MVAIESVQLRDKTFMRVDKYPMSGINPATSRFEDMGIKYLFTLYMVSDNGSNIQLASCVLLDNGVIERFGVHRDFYGKGYGTMLINYVKAFASAKGYTSLKIYATPLIKVLRFFSNRGFNLLKEVTYNNETMKECELPIEKQKKPIEMMSYRNGHNPQLVDKINLIGNDPTRKPLFHSIVKFLANSYEEECNENICICGEITDEVVEQYSYDILTNVFDDKDLETIISYCRIDCWLGQDKERFKDLDEVIAHFNKRFHDTDIRVDDFFKK